MLGEISDVRLKGMRLSGQRLIGMRPGGMRPNGMRLKGYGSTLLRMLDNLNNVIERQALLKDAA